MFAFGIIVYILGSDFDRVHAVDRVLASPSLAPPVICSDYDVLLPMKQSAKMQWHVVGFVYGLASEH